MGKGGKKCESYPPPPPPPRKNKTASDALSTLQDYERLISGCSHLCRNYTSLLYRYANLLTQLESVIMHNHTVLTHCLTSYTPPLSDTEKTGVFTRYLREHGFVPV